MHCEQRQEKAWIVSKKYDTINGLMFKEKETRSVAHEEKFIFDDQAKNGVKFFLFSKH